ncbi:DUF1385 domain-containing protein [Desulfohalovibrio reitneri]|uniref:DUF1385 domain-containing protein n=1 Tax=Desulfohalovibrio reitneri TaxID=1307759 RepID=UPI000690508F|nr:DUF1385 domain-containing protein [Desulfohalovibrio reitneri]
MAAPQTVGGQAVLEGVMMRRGSRLAVAVRKPSGEIDVQSRPWRSLGLGRLARIPFVRGFPVLVETMVNGVTSLNHSARVALEEEAKAEGKGSEMSNWALAGTVVFAFAMALGLFVVLPHLASMGLTSIGLAGDLDSLSFHAWDGVIKLAVFILYILAISLMPDIRRVFQYHGAEHKSIWAYESSGDVSPALAAGHSRLHPRCGTTFLLFVVAFSILLFAVLVPLVLSVWSPESTVLRHAWTLVVKLGLMVPVSCLAYELIKVSGKLGNSFLGRMLSAPGMGMQMLTTYEPDESQLEVAEAALRAAVGLERKTEAAA